MGAGVGLASVERGCKGPCSVPGTEFVPSMALQSLFVPSFVLSFNQHCSSLGPTRHRFWPGQWAV